MYTSKRLPTVLLCTLFLFTLSLAYSQSNYPIIPRDLSTSVLLVEYIDPLHAKPDRTDKLWRKQEGLVQMHYTLSHEFIPYEYFLAPLEGNSVPDKYQDTQTYRYLLRGIRSPDNLVNKGISWILIDRADGGKVVCDFTDYIWDKGSEMGTKEYYAPIGSSFRLTIKYIIKNL